MWTSTTCLWLYSNCLPCLTMTIINEQILKPFSTPHLQHRFHKGQFREFSPGQTVLIRDYRNLDKWISGTIVERSGPLSYIVETYPGITYRRHVDQIPPTIQREDLPKWFLSLQVAEPASTFKDSVPNSFCSWHLSSQGTNNSNHIRDDRYFWKCRKKMEETI